MRNFDKYEKAFIKLISKIELESNETFPRFLQDKYFTKSNKQALIIRHDSQDVLFYMSPEVFDNEAERAVAIKKFWSLIGLVEYLNEQRYISNIPIKKQSGLDLMYQEFDDTISLVGDKLILNKSGYYLKTSKPDLIYNSDDEIVLKGILWNDLYQSLTKNILGIIYPSEGIQYLIKNDFKSEEDKKYHRQLRLTWYGLLLSAILGGFSILSSIDNSKEDETFKSNILSTVKKMQAQGKEINTNLNNGIESIKTDVEQSKINLKVNQGRKDSLGKVIINKIDTLIKK
jgi:hypothetical protein